jgi:tRNA G37 N-methylase TrmD
MNFPNFEYRLDVETFSKIKAAAMKKVEETRNTSGIDDQFIDCYEWHRQMMLETMRVPKELLSYSHDGTNLSTAKTQYKEFMKGRHIDELR